MKLLSALVIPFAASFIISFYPSEINAPLIQGGSAVKASSSQTAEKKTSSKKKVYEVNKMRAEKTIVKDGKADITVYVLEPKNSRVYVFTELLHAGSDNSTQRSGYVTDTKVKKLMESFEKAGAVKAKDGTKISLEITDKKGKTKSFGAEKGKFLSDLKKFSEKKVYYGETGDDLYFGIDKAVDITVHFRANLGRYADLKKDCSKFAGKALVINDVSEVDFFKGEDNVSHLPEDWYGAAYIKFNKDGTDVEYANWAEDVKYLTKKKLSYDDLEALYLDNGRHKVGSTIPN